MNEAYGRSFIKLKYKSQTGDYAGCAILIQKDYVVTCAHVLSAINNNPEIGDVFNADMPYQSIQDLELELVAYYPVEEKSSFEKFEDLALLQWKNIDFDKTKEKLSIKFPKMYSQKNHGIDLYSTKSKDNISAKCTGITEEGWLTIDTKKTVEAGDSGSPIWNTQLSAITGMLVARKRKDLTCYAIPTKKILDAFKVQLSSPKNQVDESDVIHDDVFLRDVSFDILQSLQKSNLLYEKLLTASGQYGSSKKLLRKYLIKESTKGNFVEVIQHIDSALINGFSELQYEADKEKEVHQLLTISEQLLSQLLLFSIRSEWMESFHSSCATLNNYELPDIDYIGVQIIIARQAQMYPEFRNEDSELKIGYLGGMVTAKDLQESVDLTLKALCNLVFPHKVITSIDDKMIERLNSRIKNSKKKTRHISKRKRYSLIINKKTDKFSEDVRKNIAEKLPELTWITLRMGDSEDVFLIDDTDLFDAITDFYETLDNCREELHE